MNPYDPRQPPGPPYPQYPQQQQQQQQYPQQQQQQYQQQQQGYPQQQQGYPQQQYPQQAYGQPAAPPKKGMGAGAIIGIILGVLVVLGGGITVVLVLLLGDSSSTSAALSEAADNSNALKTKATTLQRAVATRDSKQVEAPLLDFAMLPDKALPWFADRFGSVGADVYSEWDRDVFKELPNLIKPFKEAETKGYTNILVTRLGSAAEGAACSTPFCMARTGQHAKIFKAMKKPTPLYVLRFAKPGSADGINEDEVAYFAVVNGQMTYIGDLVTLW